MQTKIHVPEKFRVLLGFVLMYFIPLSLLAINSPLNLRRACKAQNDSDIVLKWTVPMDACNSFQSYYIYGRSGLIGPFNIIDSVNTLSQNQYNHKGAFLITNTWQYFIVVHFDCAGNPTLSSDTLSIDLTQTVAQFIDSVSVDPITGKYIIGWKTNSSIDLAGYKIYTVNGTNNLLLTDVDNTTNQFTDSSSSPSVSTKTYSIAAYDSCNNITAIIDKHTPVILSVSFDSCSRSFTFNWSGYIGFPLTKYQIFASVNGGPSYNENDFLNVAGPLNYTLNDTSIHDGDNMCFFVRAISSNNASISSSSNIVCIQAMFISLATINYISHVNVISPTCANIDWITDNYNYISSVVLQQSIDGTIYITRIKIKPIANTFTFLADSLNTDATKYFFRVIIYNVCNQAQDTSNICNSVLLHAQKLSKSANKITWNDYLDFNAGVDRYEIYQGTGDAVLGHSLNLIATLISDSLEYTDMQFPATILNDGVCYYVIAYEKPGNSFGVSSASCKSNMVCVPGDLLVFFPDAFRPASTIENNVIFRPKGLYIDYTKSWMKIYNRWGELIFDCTDLLKGWDGTTMNGTPCQQDQYIFTSFIASLKGKNQYVNGIIYLIR